MHNTKTFCCSMAAMLLSLSPNFATAEGEHGSDAHHAHPTNTISIGISNTWQDGGASAPTLSMSYNRLVADKVAVGVLAEYATDPLDFWIIGVPFRYIPGNGWIFTAMPAVEYHNSHSEPLFRLGVGYDFVIDEGATMAPEINVDWVDGHTNVIAGLVFSFGF